jgi:hypothetical protein
MTPKPTTDEAESLPPLPPEVDAVWCMVRGEKDLVEAQDYYYTADQMRAYAAQAVAAALSSLPQPTGDGWQSIESAPKDGTDFLAWFQKHTLDEDDMPTDEVIGGAQAIVSFTGGAWNEPEWLGAHGAYFMEDWCFAEEPTCWHPLPQPPKETPK